MFQGSLLLWTVFPEEVAGIYDTVSNSSQGRNSNAMGNTENAATTPGKTLEGRSVQQQQTVIQLSDQMTAVSIACQQSSGSCTPEKASPLTTRPAAHLFNESSRSCHAETCSIIINDTVNNEINHLKSLTDLSLKFAVDRSLNIIIDHANHLTSSQGFPADFIRDHKSRGTIATIRQEINHLHKKIAKKNGCMA